ncbi:hypothetical protein SAMN05216483_0383 [Streptomyces sp. 2131.1]|uniref:hypothetical protein n=1 Tax=Streptomyces sp. 2131.1 TaxID=1855346 RepID=UPI000897B0EE|nr:hypothetical protein [Streptomyces sp. 2131.1]SEB76880.1 hypothetical protein SAMN05216483_0383 [Streptomyces sp. 2131.1]
MTEDELDEENERVRRSEVWQGILAAFGCRRPPPPPLTYRDSPMADRVEQTLNGKDWNSLTPEELLAIRLDLTTLRPEAFWYYFASFTHNALLAEDDIADDPGGWVVAALTPLPSGASERLRDRIQALSGKERRAVAEFIHWYDGETYLAARDRLLSLWPL